MLLIVTALTWFQNVAYTAPGAPESVTVLNQYQLRVQWNPPTHDVAVFGGNGGGTIMGNLIELDDNFLGLGLGLGLAPPCPIPLNKTILPLFLLLLPPPLCSCIDL